MQKLKPSCPRSKQQEDERLAKYLLSGIPGPQLYILFTSHGPELSFHTWVQECLGAVVF